jgi:hypothetical protein
MALCSSTTSRKSYKKSVTKATKRQVARPKPIERGNMESMTEINETTAVENAESETTAIEKTETTTVEKTEVEKTPKEFVAMRILSSAESAMTKAAIAAGRRINRLRNFDLVAKVKDERGDVPGWVLVVLMTTGLVTAIWTIAAPRLTTILKNSLDAMNGIR